MSVEVCVVLLLFIFVNISFPYISFIGVIVFHSIYIAPFSINELRHDISSDRSYCVSALKTYWLRRT